VHLKVDKPKKYPSLPNNFTRHTEVLSYFEIRIQSYTYISKLNKSPMYYAHEE